MTERREPNEQSTESVSEAPQTTRTPETSGGTSGPEEVSEPGELRTPATDKREDVRAKLASRFSWLFIFVAAALLVSAVFGGEQWARVQEYSQIIVGAVTGVVGTIIGFYFGSQR